MFRDWRLRNRPGPVIPILIGYFPKRTVKRPDWLKANAVEEVCSASNCISAGPDDWISRWEHNEMWVYDTPELAWSAVPETTRREFELYAYKMFPVQFDGGQMQSLEIPSLRVTPVPADFEHLGFDVANRTCGNAFECSPLSCTGGAEEAVVNRHCLVDEADSAFRLAGEFEAGGAEPGPYFVVEVWRRKRVRPDSVRNAPHGYTSS